MKKAIALILMTALILGIVSFLLYVLYIAPFKEIGCETWVDYLFVGVILTLAYIGVFTALKYLFKVFEWAADQLID